MRCPACNKFVPYYTEADPEVFDAEADRSENAPTAVVVTAEATRTLPCGECGTELASASLTMEQSVELACTCEKGKMGELTVEAEFPSPTTRTEGKGRRYRTYYGVEMEVHIKCECGASATVNLEGEERASYFESLV